MQGKDFAFHFTDSTALLKAYKEYCFFRKVGSCLLDGLEQERVREESSVSTITFPIW